MNTSGRNGKHTHIHTQTLTCVCLDRNEHEKTLSGFTDKVFFCSIRTAVIKVEKLGSFTLCNLYSFFLYWLLKTKKNVITKIYPECRVV